MVDLSSFSRQQRTHTARGNRTRQQIKLAAGALLERLGYRNMRLADIAEEAGIPTSLIYRYFSGKSELVLEIVSEEAERQLGRMYHPAKVDDPYEAILSANRHIVHWFCALPGIRKCLYLLDEDEPEFFGVYRAATMKWNRKVSRGIARRCPDAPLTETQRIAVASLLAGMVDSFLMELFVHRNQELQEAFADEEEVAVFLSIMWFRALYLRNPPADKMQGFEALLELRLPEPA